MPVPPGTEDTFGPWPGSTTTDGGDPVGGDVNGDDTVVVDSGVPFWKDVPRIYDRVVMAGFEFPGVCTVDAELRRKLDKKAPKGTDGATITDDGEDQAPVEIEVRLYTREDWQRFELIVPFISPKTPGKRVAVAIDYPTLALFGINTVYVESVSVPKFSDDKRQFMVVKIGATEWRPPPKPAKSKSSTTKESADNPEEMGNGTGTRWVDDGNYDIPLEEYGTGTGTRLDTEP